MLFVFFLLLLSCTNSTSNEERLFRRIEDLEHKIDKVAVATDAADPVVARASKRSGQERNDDLCNDIKEIKESLKGSVIFPFKLNNQGD